MVSFWKPEVCGQTVFPDRSVLIGQKLVENAKIENFKCAENWDETFLLILQNTVFYVFVKASSSGFKKLCSTGDVLLWNENVKNPPVNKSWVDQKTCWAELKFVLCKKSFDEKK